MTWRDVRFSDARFAGFFFADDLFIDRNPARRPLTTLVSVAGSTPAQFSAGHEPKIVITAASDRGHASGSRAMNAPRDGIASCPLSTVSPIAALDRIRRD
jgi:hypothetical protein